MVGLENLGRKMKMYIRFVRNLFEFFSSQRVERLQLSTALRSTRTSMEMATTPKSVQRNTSVSDRLFQTYDAMYANI